MQDIINMPSFKICPKCNHSWETRDDLLNDPSVVMLGFMPSFEKYSKGSFLFNHVLPDRQCGSTFAVFVICFEDLCDSPVHDDLKFGSKECEGHCVRLEDLQQCDAACSNADVRKIMHKILLKLKNQPEKPIFTKPG